MSSPAGATSTDLLRASSARARAVRGPGRGTEVWLARHAEVHEDWRGRAYGDLDVPLSEDGRRRTRELARDLAGLRPARVLSSPLERALVLGRDVAERCGAPLEVLPGLREVHRGTWQGRRVDELSRDEPEAVRAFYADPWDWRGHGGESDAMIAARIAPVVRSELEELDGGRLLVTTHYNVIRVFALCALGIPAESSFALRVDPGRLVVMRDDPAGWRLLHSNLASPAHADTGEPTTRA